MELWIRSQEKSALCKVNYVYVSNNSIYCNKDFLGTYQTKERALEVLDEIQGKITQNECLKSMITKLNNIKGEEEKIGKLFKETIYEMPKE